MYGPSTIIDCDFTGNVASAGWGGAIHGCGAISSRFYANSAHSGGSAAYEASLVRCVIGAQSAVGGSVIAEPITLRDSVIFGNPALTADNCGRIAGIISGCTIVGHRVGMYSGVNAVVSNTIFFANNYAIQGLMSTSCNVFWANGNGNPDDGTNRHCDPMFCNATEMVFTVDASSPCLPESSLGCGLIGALEAGCAAVHSESVIWGDLKARYR